MALVRVMWAETNAELVTVVALLEAHDIPCFIHSAGFGGLHPGVQINTYNTRSIMVPEETVADALELLRDYQAQPPVIDSALDVPVRSKLRTILEFFLFGWFIPGGRRCVASDADGR